jgi:phage-related minor tail protein
MSGGSVPGSGHHDTVPRTLDAGAFVIRKAAVQKYGGGALSRLANGVAHFAAAARWRCSAAARRRADPNDKPSGPEEPRGGRALKMIDLGLQGMNEYTGWLQWNYGASVSLDMRSKTMESYGKQAQQDRRALEDFIGRKTLTGNERQNLERIKQTWRQAMAQPLLWGKDLERELIDYMEQNQGEFYRRGGMAKSDTVPAMLTPGEFVVNKDAVSRYGAGFFEAINNLSAPAQALAGRALAGIQGFASGGLVQPAGAACRVLAARQHAQPRAPCAWNCLGQQKVNATVDARDEARCCNCWTPPAPALPEDFRCN